MAQVEMNPSAAKFISSLVKSLQIICNGHVDFSQSIELIGHINVRIDHKFKFDYIVDEQVSKEGEDSSTTFLSNSYHSNPPLAALAKESDFHTTSLRAESSTAHEVMNTTFEDGSHTEDSNKFAVTVENTQQKSTEENPMVFKLEEDDDSDECIVLPSSEDLTDTQAETPKRRHLPRRDKAKFPKPVLVQTAPKKFANLEELKRIDQLWNKSMDTYFCSQCSYSTTFRNRVRAHCRSVHMGIPRKYKGNEKGRFVCDKCGKEFTSNRGFRMHILSKHLQQFPYHCQQCSKGFMSVSAHRDHMNMHAGIALQCMGCHTLFYTEYGLKRHLIKKHPELLVL